jgi:arylsulfatase A-like enzyme
MTIERTRSRTTRGLFAWAIVVGAVTGLVQVLARLASTRVFERAIWVNPQLVWTAPFSNALVMMLVALVILAFSRIVRPIGVYVGAGIFVGLAALTLLLPFPRVQPIAYFLLAAGISVQAARLVRPRAERLTRLVERIVLPVVGVVVVLGSAVNLSHALRERAGYRSLPAARDGSPNVLFVIWDTVRAASLSLYGYPRETTPRLDAFALHAVVFENAFATAPWTLASHASFFTGYYPFDLSTTWRTPLDDARPTLAERLADHGYATAGFVANRIFGPPVFGLGRGFTHYESTPLDVRVVLDGSPIIRFFTHRFNEWFGTNYVPDRRTAEDINDAFLGWQDRHDDRPFFAFLNYMDAHEPYIPPSPYDTMFGHPMHRRIESDRPPTAERTRDLTDAYDGGIAYVDAEFGLLIGELGRRGLMDSAIVIVASDHGEHLGEHELYDHGNSLYAPLLHVPLVVRAPGTPAARVAAPVSLRSLPATVLDLAGIRDTDVPGASLASQWAEDGAAPGDPILSMVPVAANQPARYPLARGAIRSVVVWPYLFISNTDGQEELFDLSVDPLSLDDLAPSDSAGVARMRERLARYPDRTFLPK